MGNTMNLIVITWLVALTASVAVDIFYTPNRPQLVVEYLESRILELEQINGELIGEIYRLQGRSIK